MECTVCVPVRNNPPTTNTRVLGQSQVAPGSLELARELLGPPYLQLTHYTCVGGPKPFQAERRIVQDEVQPRRPPKHNKQSAGKNGKVKKNFLREERERKEEKV